MTRHARVRSNRLPSSSQRVRHCDGSSFEDYINLWVSFHWSEQFIFILFYFSSQKKKQHTMCLLFPCNSLSYYTELKQQFSVNRCSRGESDRHWTDFSNFETLGISPESLTQPERPRSQPSVLKLIHNSCPWSCSCVSFTPRKFNLPIPNDATCGNSVSAPARVPTGNWETRVCEFPVVREDECW